MQPCLVRATLALAALSFSPLGSVTPAHAQAASPEEDEARMHFRLGAAYHESGRFAEAAREFELAYELSHRPALLHNMFVAYRDAGNLPGAVRALREYLRLNPDAEDHAQLTARLANMERLAAQQGEDTPAEEPEEREAQAPQSTGSSAAPAPEAAGGGTWTPGWIIGGVGVATALAGVVTGGLALGEQSALDAMCDGSHLCEPGFEATRDSAGLLAGLTDVLLVTGGVVTVVGLVLALTVSTGDDGPSATLVCTGTGCLAVAEARFRGR